MSFRLMLPSSEIWGVSAQNELEIFKKATWLLASSILIQTNSINHKIRHSSANENYITVLNENLSKWGKTGDLLWWERKASVKNISSTFWVRVLYRVRPWATLLAALRTSQVTTVEVEAHFLPSLSLVAKNRIQTIQLARGWEEAVGDAQVRYCTKLTS